MAIKENNHIPSTLLFMMKEPKQSKLLFFLNPNLHMFLLTVLTNKFGNCLAIVNKFQKYMNGNRSLCL